jgi:bifunctional enzyme CysN/CysC
MSIDHTIDEESLIAEDIHAFLERNQQKELLRFVTVGSVDDGKSTLIGRLLHDTKGVYDDQLKDATLTSSTGETAIDFARITDGLRAEREQGITIDVAYRYFSTPARKFIIADTPGHVQYTRNMATGASTAHVALILIDARLGVLLQSKRHATIASLLGIPHLLVCVNKMDLVEYDEARYEEIKAEFTQFTADLGFRSVDFLPVSALFGVNIVEPTTTKIPWYTGPTVLRYLETVEIAQVFNTEQFRFATQYVIRPNLNYRGYAGQIGSGTIKKGDPIIVLPSGVQSHIEAIDTFDGELEEAYAPMSITLRLTDEVDCSRGDWIVHPDHTPTVSRNVESIMVWMSEEDLDPNKDYWIKHGTQYVHVNIDSIQWKMDLETLEKIENVGSLSLNDIACVRLIAHRPIAFDSYRLNRASGAFILIDFMSNNTVGAGMIEGEFQQESSNLTTLVDQTARQSLMDQHAHFYWIIDHDQDSANGSTHAFELEQQFVQHGLKAVVIDTNDARYPKVHTASEALRIAKRMLDLEMVVIFHSDASDVRYAIEQFTEQTSVGCTLITDDPTISIDAFATVSMANSASVVETYTDTL